MPIVQQKLLGLLHFVADMVVLSFREMRVSEPTSRSDFFLRRWYVEINTEDADFFGWTSSLKMSFFFSDRLSIIIADCYPIVLTYINIMLFIS